MVEHRPVAIVTGASTGISLELAKCCAELGFDLLIAANGSETETAVDHVRQMGASVEAFECDLADEEGVDKILAAGSVKK